MSIPRKLKPCKTCGDPKYLFSRGECLECYNMQRALAESNKPKTPGMPVKPKRLKIASCSKTREAALAKYRRLRYKYFAEHPVCEYPGCNSQNITLHHKRGRIGAFLTDKRYFCSLCQKHHRWGEENPTEAQSMGLSESRLNK